MFNSRHLFSSLIDNPPVGFCISDSTISLFSKGSGKVNLLINGKIFVLEECLLMPNPICNLIRLMELCNGDLAISQSNSYFKLLEGEQAEMKGRIFNNLMRVEYSLPMVQVTKLPSNLWHQ
ncbi:hypothetical protein O181_029639 [Austropuccinia psidii MF-1]|uniref:Uncharacterized protein n=1 Tax=Austropuccinia psidii MF-1 TaxID=1389203 RepID=A0A9Q3H4R7_9BASI|nr:hypothetical protein [Austropuccinia psidii MF-1]